MGSHAVTFDVRNIADARPATLADMHTGQAGYVSAVRLTGLPRRRLMDLGFVPGARVKVVLDNPAGDPRVYEVRGTRIALRRGDAAQVEITEGDPLAGSALRAAPACATACRGCVMGEAAEAPLDAADVDKAQFTVALAGNPNTGKSTVFNALTGLRQHVGNWPGKTVSRAEGAWRHQGYTFKLVDLPGTYSLLSTSADEEVARDYLLFGAPDCTVAVVDATCLERNLNLVFQILEITGRVVVCVNLLDEARRRGIAVDLKALEARLGVPVVGASARNGEGLGQLRDAVLLMAAGRIKTDPLRIPYEPELQRAIDTLLPDVERAFPGVPNARWIAMRLIEGGDARLREEIESGVLSGDDGRIGEYSLGGIAPAVVASIKGQ
jgi:ferrous iron transport protein B